MPGPKQDKVVRTFLFPAILATSVGCSSTPPSREPIAATDDATLYGTGPSERILFRPQGDPESLLGLEVTEDPTGRLIIATARKPGCTVRARRVKESWERAYTDVVDNVTGGGLTVPMIAKLKAEYGEAATVAVAVNNDARIDGDLKGDCGKRVIRSVRVGTGTRFVGMREDVLAEARVAVDGVEAGGGTRRNQATTEAFSWSEPQAWSFEVEERNSGDTLSLDAEMPPRLQDGEEYSIRVRANRDSWLIVYGQEADGRLFKLLPNTRYPVIAAGAGQETVLPALVAGLRDPSVGAKETIVILGFTDRAYVDQFEPPEGAADEERMQAWEEQVRPQLDAIPRGDWERIEYHYEIRPAEKR